MKEGSDNPTNEKGDESDPVAMPSKESETILQMNDSAVDWIKNLVQLYRDTQKEDLDYLDAHPEIQQIITVLLDEFQKNKPPNLHRFAALYFQHNQHKIKLKTQK